MGTLQLRYYYAVYCQLVKVDNDYSTHQLQRLLSRRLYGLTAPSTGTLGHCAAQVTHTTMQLLE